jgi:hypothetical protein
MFSFKHNTKKDWTKTLALETENAVSYVPTQEQDSLRCVIAKNINTLYSNYNKDQYSRKNIVRRAVFV